MRKIFFIMFVLSVLIISGCKSKTPGLEPTAILYHQGIEALDIQPVKGLPPAEIMEGNEFIIGLELRNKGAYDIEGGRISIYGFKGSYVAIENSVIEVNIEGKKTGFPEGGYEVINFKAKNIGVPEIIETFTPSYTIDAFYRYQTEAGVDVCINPNAYSYIKTKETICEPKEIILKGGQGAPVAVTRVEEAVSPFGDKVKINFIIHFENQGNGEVKGGVYVTDVRLSNVPISCFPDKPVEIKKKEDKSILCTADTLLSSGTYIAPLSIKLAYEYNTLIDKKIKIIPLRLKK